MTSALETIRYHAGMAGEEVADMVDELEAKVARYEQAEELRRTNGTIVEAELREQVEKLTKERDEYKHEVHCCNIEYGDVHDSYTQVSEELAALAEQVEKLTKQRDSAAKKCDEYFSEAEEYKVQLAALAAQNEKMREALEMIVVSSLTHPRVSAYADKTLSLPDLTSPVLNRIRAEGMRMAAEILIDPMDRAAAQKICAQADELEKQNG